MRGVRTQGGISEADVQYEWYLGVRWGAQGVGRHARNVRWEAQRVGGHARSVSEKGEIGKKTSIA